MRVNRVGARWVTGNASLSPGSVCWVDVSSTDPAGSREFYSGLFGWTYQINSRPGRAQYLTALCGGRPVAGLSGAAVPADHRAAWPLYWARAHVMRTAQLLHTRGRRGLAVPPSASYPGSRGRLAPRGAFNSPVPPACPIFARAESLTLSASIVRP